MPRYIVDIILLPSQHVNDFFIFMQRMCNSPVKAYKKELFSKEDCSTMSR